MKRHSILVIQWGVIWAVIYVATRFTGVDYKEFINPIFLFGFLGLFIGFALSLYIHIVSIVQTIKVKFVGKEAKLKKLYSGLKENIMVLIYGLLLFSSTYILTPIIRARYVTFLDADFSILIDSFSMSVFVVAMLSLWDLMMAAFMLSEKMIEENT